MVARSRGRGRIGAEFVGARRIVGNFSDQSTDFQVIQPTVRNGSGTTFSAQKVTDHRTSCGAGVGHMAGTSDTFPKTGRRKGAIQGHGQSLVGGVARSENSEDCRMRFPGFSKSLGLKDRGRQARVNRAG